MLDAGGGCYAPDLVTESMAGNHMLHQVRLDQLQAFAHAFCAFTMHHLVNQNIRAFGKFGQLGEI